MIKVEGLYKKLGGQPVLEDISFNVSEGEIIAVLGLSGAGKTVLLKHMIGLFRPDRGRVVTGPQGHHPSGRLAPDSSKYRRWMG